MFSKLRFWGLAYFLISLCCIPSLASPVPDPGTSVDLAPKDSGTSKDLALRDFETSLDLDPRGAPSRWNDVCLLLLVATMHSTFNRMSGTESVDVTTAMRDMRAPDNRLEFNVIRGHPFLSWRAYTERVIINGHAHDIAHIEVRNTGSQHQGLILEQPEAATSAPTRYITIDVPPAALHAPSGRWVNGATCTSIDNPPPGQWILRTLT
ncbi:hypothetical protein ONS96_001428 [Cadophora gregata f. sp. sojae]|nr:hypothetical protein ONS96_001428 [Cadophora gregata f. sp. sojae]